MFDYDTAIADMDCPLFTNVANLENEDSDNSMEGWDEDE